MDVTVVAAAVPAIAVPAIAGAVTTIARAWIERAQRQKPCPDCRHGLPPGSRVIDLGEYGLVIEVGTAEGEDYLNAAR
jgi:hypothetical protein